MHHHLLPGEGARASGPVSCPQCRAAFHKSNVRPNKQLANIVETIKQLGLLPAKGQPEALCGKHEEKLKLFCEEDGEAICVVCRETLSHWPHNVYPTEEAAQVYKIRLQKSLELLLKEVDEVQKHAMVERTKTQECKEVVKKKRERIVTEFGKLHQLLAEEEKLLLQKLEKEEKIILQRINGNLTRLLELRSSLDKLILEIREKFQQSADGLLKVSGWQRSPLSRQAEGKGTWIPGHWSPGVRVRSPDTGVWVCLTLPTAFNSLLY
ncbi:unnamed protein product [Caretta caretta]